MQVSLVIASFFLYEGTAIFFSFYLEAYCSYIYDLPVIIYSIHKKVADKENGVSNPNAEAFADAYLKALDNVEHGCKIVLPPHLHAEVKPKKFQKYLTVPEEDEFTDEE